MLNDIQALFDCLQDNKDHSDILANMELLAKFLLDASFDDLWAAASSASAIAARRVLWMKSWKLDARQRSLVQKLPFTGDKLFGPELD